MAFFQKLRLLTHVAGLSQNQKRYSITCASIRLQIFGNGFSGADPSS
jgi:hypothetical protein